MKPYSRIHQLYAFGLILLFTIQAGLGLWLHRTLHHHPAGNIAYTKSTLPVLQQAAALPFTCNCANDFLIPFIAAPKTEFLSPFQAFFTVSAPADYCTFSCALQVFRPLRAPPVFICLV